MKIPLSIVVDEKSGDVRVYYEDGGYMTMDTHTMYHMPLGQVVAHAVRHRGQTLGNIVIKIDELEEEKV